MEDKQAKVLHYEVEAKYVPDILAQDWDAIELNEEEKETAIRLFLWRYGEDSEKDNSEFVEWNLKKDKLFNKGFYNGKISFSLNRDSATIMLAMIKAVTDIIRYRSNDNLKDVGVFISLAELFSKIVKVSFLKNYERCVFIQIIVLTNNSSSYPLTEDEIEKRYTEEIFTDNKCPYQNIFQCDCYRDNACLKDRIENDNGKRIKLSDILLSLEQKKVIFRDQTNEKYIHIA